MEIVSSDVATFPANSSILRSGVCTTVLDFPTMAGMVVNLILYKLFVIQKGGVVKQIMVFVMIMVCIDARYFVRLDDRVFFGKNDTSTG